MLAASTIPLASTANAGLLDDLTGLLSAILNPKEPKDEEVGAPPPLSTVKVPKPSNLSEFVRDEQAAIVLGKALFWDMQLGSDGRTACATCHFQAGADNRLKNSVGLPANPQGVKFRGANTTLKTSDFPFHRLKDVDNRKSTVEFDTGEIAGSQGVIRNQFIGIIEGSPVDVGRTEPDPVHSLNGVNLRQVEPRNSPTMINAVFNDRQFWDGRANRFFNGVDPFGKLNSQARVYRSNGTGGTSSPVAIAIDNSSLASQASGPPLSSVEMSWAGRSFPQVGQKMLSLRPLALQQVHKDDSVLGKFANSKGKGLLASVSYSSLIQQAFQPKWWNGKPVGEFTLMEQNFSLYFGLAVQAYEATLISDQTPYDKYAAGNKSALTKQQVKGLDLFLNAGSCINCHGGPEFAGGTVREVRDEPIETMKMADGTATYDNGFYNIAVRPTQQDLGVGASHPQFGPLSLTLQAGTKGRVAVKGAFKTPTMRNIELTGPYMHNGGMSSLKQVVEFYARGTDFADVNKDDLDPDVGGVSELRGKSENVGAIIAFLKSLTDERVRYQKAPFDHPELIIPNGHGTISTKLGTALDNNVVLPAVGAGGGAALRAFEDVLKSGN